MTARAAAPRAAETPRVVQAAPPTAVSASRAPESGDSAWGAPLSAPAVGGRVSTLLAPRVQASTRVSQPGDPAEREAVATARKVMRMAAPPPPAAGPPRGSAPAALRLSPLLRAPQVHRQAAPGDVHRQAAGKPRPAAADVVPEIRANLSGGTPLPPSVRRFMEPRFKASFGAVRVHTDEKAAGLAARLSARAFAFGRHIFFGRGQYSPDTAEGMELIAHELTHTIQQREVVQRQEEATVSERTEPHVQRLGFDDILDWLADKANAIPGFRMFTIVLGVNPVNMSPVDRSAANILRAVVEFIPGGNLITRALDTYGIFEKVGGWIEGQIRSLGMVGSAFKSAISQFIDSLGLRDLLRPGSVWERAKRIFTDPIDKLKSFAAGFIGGILDFLREAVLRPLAKLAEGTQAYDLLKAVLGKDPITGDKADQSADALIGGFMKLIGQEEVYANIKKANAVSRALGWFKGVLSGAIAFVTAVPGLIVSTLRSITLEDFLPITNLFGKVGRAFGGFVGSFFSWGLNQVLGLLQIVFEVVAPGAVPYIKKAAGAFTQIIRNPIGFIGNLVRAGIQGFRQFAGNFLNHLRASLIAWLTGTMAGSGVYIPQAFNVREIVMFVLSVLGLTWQNIRQKLVAVVGETAVRAMEGGFQLVRTLVTQGPAAAWQQIVEGISNLRDMVMEQVMSFVRTRIVQAAITRLVTSLNPAGAFIQAIIAIYNTVMFFIERLRQIAQVAMSFIDSISAIASGNIGSAAARVERTMAGLLTLVISFLARLVGLGKVSDAVLGLINRVRAPVFRAIDRVVAWIVAQVRRLGSFVGGRDARTPAEKQRDLDRAVRELTPRLQPMLQRGTSRLVLRGRMLLWKREYRLTDLSVAGGKVRAAINPTKDMFSTEEIDLGRALEPILREAERLHLLAVARNPQSSQRLTDARAAAAAEQPLPKDLTPDEMVILLRREGLRKSRRALLREGYQVTLANFRRKVEKIGAYAATHLPGIKTKKRRWGYGNWPWSVNRQLEEGAGDNEGSRALREEVEVARGQGNLPAARVGGALVAASEASGIDLRVQADVTVRGAANVVSTAEVTSGRMAPMATGSSAVAAGSGERPTRKPSPSQVQAATDVRHGSFAVIFNTLSAAARRKGDPLLKLPGRQGEALKDVAEKFDAWKKIVGPNPAANAGTPAAMAAAAQLQGAIQRFLAAMQAGG
jgi:Domain of unknown function (DUF4157)